MLHEQLTILVCPQGNNWVAQCVEYDIAAQAKTVDDVMYEFQRTLQVQLAMDLELGREPLSDVPPAPEHFRKMARAGHKIEAQYSLPRFQSAGTAGRRGKRLRRTTEVVLADSLCLN